LVHAPLPTTPSQARSTPELRPSERGPARGVQEIDAHRTPLGLGRIRAAIAGAHRRLTGKSIPRPMLDLLAAHVAHETARGERMFNFNFGGIKGAGPSGLTARYRTTEVLDGKAHNIVDGFRAYRSAEEGASDYLRLLKERFPGAWASAADGDAAAFADRLKQAGYFTADLTGYTQALQAHLRAPQPAGRTEGASYLYGSELARESVRIDGVPDSTLPTSIEVARVVGAVGSMAARIGTPVEIADGEEYASRRT
jgi:hypothetical protein